jgi:hypothetical protein
MVWWSVEEAQGQLNPWAFLVRNGNWFGKKVLGGGEGFAVFLYCMEGAEENIWT